MPCVRFYRRLYAKGRVLGYTRGKRNQKPNTSLIQVEGVANKEEAKFYFGKRVAYVYKAERPINGSKVSIRPTVLSVNTDIVCRSVSFGE